jgi:hypothetical protein
MSSSTRSAIRVLVLVAVTSANSACDQRAYNVAVADGLECSVRVIVRFTAEANDTLLADIARTNSLALDPIGAITRDLGVYTLRAAGSDDDCAAAVDRLRRDDRVRSVDIDEQRAIHEQ